MLSAPVKRGISKTETPLYKATDRDRMQGWKIIDTMTEARILPTKRTNRLLTRSNTVLDHNLPSLYSFSLKATKDIKMKLLNLVRLGTMAILTSAAALDTRSPNHLEARCKAGMETRPLPCLRAILNVDMSSI